jgi:hypothetical protein
MNEEFVKECSIVCPNEDALCNIVLDMCYTRAGSKIFAWNIAGRIIVNNLIKRNDGIVSYPQLDPDGDIAYCGNTFSMQKIRIGGAE